MRILVLALIPILTAAIGYLFSLKYRQAKDFWNQFEFWHKKIKAEIAFSQKSLPEILSDNKQNDMFLIAANEYLTDKKIKANLAFLSKEEIAFLHKYLQNLGKTDKSSQMDLLNSFESELEHFFRVAEENNKKYRQILVKLGFLLGLIVFILAI